jgi:hypothetical protein
MDARKGFKSHNNNNNNNNNNNKCGVFPLLVDVRVLEITLHVFYMIMILFDKYC